MMLDTRRTFDEMVLAHSTKQRAEQIFANPFYRTISTSFSGTQEYMAMEKLSTLSASGEYELIVVDTPPSRSALDFLDAPQRLSSFLDGRMIRLLVTPGRGMMKLVGAGLTLFTKAIRAVIGGQMLTDATQFVRLFEDLFGGFRERAEATYQLLRREGTRFVVVATPESESIREASYFADRLRAEQMPLAGMVLNRTHPVPESLAALSAVSVDQAMRRVQDADPLTAGVLSVFGQLQAINAEERRMLARVTRAHPGLPIRQIPALPTDVHEVADLRAIDL
jgi:anion-transporting  ArsA/GET3 family ATPase